MDRDGAAAQLAALQADRAALADRVMQPWWYDVCLGLLLRPPERPAWLKVGLPALLAVGIVSVLATLNHQWPMTALWRGLASGPLAVAWLRAKSPAPTGTTPPPAMEPTA